MNRLCIGGGRDANEIVCGCASEAVSEGVGVGVGMGVGVGGAGGGVRRGAQSAAVPRTYPSGLATFQSHPPATSALTQSKWLFLAA